MFNPSFLNENNNVIYKTEENIPLLKEEPLTKEIKAFFELYRNFYTTKN